VIEVQRQAQPLDQSLFDYSQLDDQTESIVRQIAIRIRQRNVSMAQQYIDNGKDLLAAKERIPFGSWLRWIEEEFSWKEHTAHRMMRVARFFGHLQLAESQVSISALDLLSQHDIPGSIRSDVESLIESGSVKTTNDVVTHVEQSHPRLAEEIRSTNSSFHNQRNQEIANSLPLQVAEIAFAVRNMQMALASCYGVPLRAPVGDALERMQRASDNLIQLVPASTGSDQGLKRVGVSSRYVGVFRHTPTNRWQVQLREPGTQKKIHLGRFDSEEEAARVYDAKARQLYGDKARLNFPDDIESVS